MSNVQLCGKFSYMSVDKQESIEELVESIYDNNKRQIMQTKVFTNTIPTVSLVDIHLSASTMQTIL